MNSQTETSTHHKQMLWYWLPLLIWMGTIFSLSHQPKTNLAPAQPSSFFTSSGISWGSVLIIDWDTVAGKTAHVIVFGILAFLVWRVKSNLRLALWVSMLYGFSDEVHQLFIPGRTGRLFDVFFDCLGAILVVLFLRRWQLERAQEKLEQVPKPMLESVATGQNNCEW